MFKPMLALGHEKLYAKGESTDSLPAALKFPVLVQPKFDGIRISIVGGKALTRTLKEIPNREIFEALSRPEFEGLDGEILVGDPRSPTAYRDTASFAMAESKRGGDWAFYVFDKWDEPGDTFDRLSRANRVCAEAGNPRVDSVITDIAQDPETLTEFEENAVVEGYEGVICRSPVALYKQGRGGKRQQELIKVKRFVDFEAEVIGVYEEMHNANEAKRNALGRTERSSAVAGKQGKGTLGGLCLRALNGPCAGVEFKCGSGFDADERADLWAEWFDPTDARLLLGIDPEGQYRANIGGSFLGRIAKIKSFPVGVKDKPRHPVFLGWRDMEVDG